MGNYFLKTKDNRTFTFVIMSNCLNVVFACYRDSLVTGLDMNIPRPFGLIICMENDKNYKGLQV